MTEPAPEHRPNDFYAELKAKATEIEARYRDLTPESARRHARSEKVLPSGYTRDAVVYRPYPPYIDNGRGAELIDADGRRVIDMCFNATSLALGHADPRVVEAVSAQAAAGSAFQAMTGKESALAQILCQRLPSAELVRFANSGSEAVMMALRVARAFTGRDTVIKFEGSYHGTYDDVQWSVSPPAKPAGGSGPGPGAKPESAGLPSGIGRVLVLPFNDAEALRAAMSENKDRIAAVIVEPMANRIGLVVPRAAFLNAARQGCDETGAVLIFDEVIAFRMGYNGAQGAVGVTPDLTVLGKVIGGGYPVGAIVGRDEVLGITRLGHPKRVTHPGTFSGNPVTMVAGMATLEALSEDVVQDLNDNGERMRSRLREVCAGLPLSVTGAGPFYKINATSRAIADYWDAATVDKEWERLAALALLNQGYFMTSTLRGCVSTATTEDQVAGFLDAFSNLIRH